MTPSEWLRRVAAVEATLLRSKRIPLNILVVNDPDAGLEEYRLPDDVVEKLWTIKIGRSDPSDEMESGRQWVARLTEAARGPRTSPGRRETYAFTALETLRTVASPGFPAM